MLTYTNEEYRIQIKYPSDWNFSQGSFTSEDNIDRDIRVLIVSFVPTSQLGNMTNLLNLLSEEIRNGDIASAETKIYNSLGRASVSIYCYPSVVKTLDKFVKDNLLEMRKQMTDFQPKSTNFRKIKGMKNKGYEIIYSATISHEDDDTYPAHLAADERKQVLSTWTMHEDRVYQITYLSNPEAYSTYLPIVNTMIDTFTVF